MQRPTIVSVCNFTTTAPNQKWVTDVTEFALFGEKIYLSPILDLHSSDLVSYVISDRPVLSMVTDMLKKSNPCAVGEGIADPAF